MKTIWTSILASLLAVVAAGAGPRRFPDQEAAAKRKELSRASIARMGKALSVAAWRTMGTNVPPIAVNTNVTSFPQVQARLSAINRESVLQRDAIRNRLAEIEAYLLELRWAVRQDARFDGALPRGTEGE